MPCAQQSRLENESGDLGIRLFPGNAPRNFEVEINRVSTVRNMVDIDIKKIKVNN